MAVFDQTWFMDLDLRQLGCKWVRSDHDRKKYHLQFASMKGLGSVWAGPEGGRLWSGTDGRDAASLAAAKANIEREVKLALQSELGQLDEALAGGPGRSPVVVSELARQALRAGLDGAVLKAVIRAANEAGSGEALRQNRTVPEGALVGLSVDGKLLAFARPELPCNVRQLLRVEASDVERAGQGVIAPLKENAVVHSLRDLAEQCEQSVFGAVRRQEESRQCFR